MKPNIFFIVISFGVSLFSLNVISQGPEEILPVFQIRDIATPARIDRLEAQEQGESTQFYDEDLKKQLDDQLAPGSAFKVKPTKYEQGKKKKRNFEFSINGGISLEAMYDTRQVIGERFNEFVLFPAPQKLDKSGLDINAKDQFSMMGVRACAALYMRGPEILGAQTCGVMSGEFNGLDDATVGLFRVTRAKVNFDWKKTSLLFGHYYHPLSLDEMFPETVSRGQGRVYDPFDYASQIRLRHRVGQFEFVLAMAKEFDSQAARWATTPDLFMQCNLFVRDHILGAGVNFHAEVPRIYSQTPPAETGLPAVDTYKTTAQVNSIYPFVFALLKLEPFDIRMRVTYAQNGSVYDLLGAYAVQYRNAATDQRLYTDLNAIACWADIIYKKFSNIEPALFVGITKNLGASKKIIKGFEYTPEGATEPTCQSMLNLNKFSDDIDYTFIFAPRLRVRFGEFSIGAELEYSRAAFARSDQEANWQDDYNDKGAVVCSKPVSNLRILLATFYNFDYASFAYK